MPNLDENWKSFKRVVNYKTTLLRENKLVSEQTESELSDADFSPEELADIEKEVAKRLAPSPTPAEPPLASTMPPTTDSFLGKPGAEAELQRIFSGEESFEPETPPTPAAAPYSPRRGEFTHGIEEVPDFDFDKFYKALDTHVGGAETSLVKHGKDYKFGREHQAAFDKLQSTSGASMEDFKLDPAELEKIRKTSVDTQPVKKDYSGKFSTTFKKDDPFNIEFDDQEWQDFKKMSDKIVTRKNASLMRRLDKGRPFTDMKVEDAIFDIAAERGLDPIQMATLVYIETRGNPRLVHKKSDGSRGAMGLLQVLNKDKYRERYRDDFGMDINKLYQCVDNTGPCDTRHFVEVLANKFEYENRNYGELTTLERYLTHQQGAYGRRGLFKKARSANSRDPYSGSDWKGKDGSARDSYARRRTRALFGNFPPRQRGKNPNGVPLENMSSAHFMYYYQNRIGRMEDAFREHYADRLNKMPTPKPTSAPVADTKYEPNIRPASEKGKVTYVIGDSHAHSRSMKENLKRQFEAEGREVVFLTKNGIDFRGLQSRLADVKKRGDAEEVIVASMGGNVASHYKEKSNPQKHIVKHSDSYLNPSMQDMSDLQSQGVRVTVFGPPYASGGRGKKKVTDNYQKSRMLTDREMKKRLDAAGIKYVSVYDETKKDNYGKYRYKSDGVHYSDYEDYSRFITSNLM